MAEIIEDVKRRYPDVKVCWTKKNGSSLSFSPFFT